MTHVSAVLVLVIWIQVWFHIYRNPDVYRRMCVKSLHKKAPNQLYGSSARVNALHACVLGCAVGLHVELGQLEPGKALALRLGHGYCGNLL